MFGSKLDLTGRKSHLILSIERMTVNFNSNIAKQLRETGSNCYDISIVSSK